MTDEEVEAIYEEARPSGSAFWRELSPEWKWAWRKALTAARKQGS